MSSGETGRPVRALVVSQYQDVQVGGAERYVHEVCRRLKSRHGFELQHLATDLTSPGDISPACWRFASASFNPRWFREVKHVLLTRRPDVLYVHHTVPGLTDLALRAARHLHLPVALMYHSDVTGPQWPHRLLGTLYQRLVGDASLTAASEVFVGTRNYADHSAALRRLRRPLVEAPPGVDAAIGEGTRRLGSRFLLFVGKPDVPSKGFPVLLRAWQRLRREDPDLELVVIGAARPPTPQPGLRWVGPVTSRRELADWYASAVLTVLPSTSSAESFGMVLAEALVAGCPVVGSRVGGIPALIEEGTTGYLAEPGDPASLLNALRLGVRHDLALRAAVHQRRPDYLTRFSWERTTDVVARSLHALAEGAPAPDRSGGRRWAVQPQQSAP